MVNTLPLSSGPKPGYAVLLFLFSTVLGSVAGGVRQEKEMEDCVQCHCCYRKSQRTYEEVTRANESSKVRRYKVHIRKINYNFMYQKQIPEN